MALITGLHTVNGKQILEVDADPSGGAGTAAPVGSLALLNLASVGTGYIKTGALDTAWTAIGSGGGGANTALSNLVATAINQSLLPGTDVTFNLGGVTFRWANLFADTAQIVSSGSVGAIITRSTSTPSGATAAAVRSSAIPLAFFTPSSGVADATATDAIYIETGNKTAGTGNSGSFFVKTGTSVGGVRGIWSVDALYDLTKCPEVKEPATTQDLTAAFTISPSKTYCPLTATGGSVTSSAVTAISNGLTAGQMLILENQDAANNIVLKNASNTKLPSGADFTLTPNSTMTLIWNGTDWVTLNVSGN